MRCHSTSCLLLLPIAATLIAAVPRLNAAEAPHPRWKIQVLVYQKTDFQYTDSTGVFHHITTQMTPSEEQVSVSAARRFYESDVPELTSGNMRPLVTIMVKTDPLRNLSPFGTCPFQGFWPDPNATIADRETNKFDSAVVVWKDVGFDSATGTSALLSCYGGLTPPTGVSQTYATFILRSVSNINRNIFKHEWGHSILFYYDASGAAPKPAVDNHINNTTTLYVHCGTGTPYILIDEEDPNPIPNSIYNDASGFTHDYYSGLTATPDQPSRCLGITPAAWATGGPVTHAIPNPGDLNGDGVVNRNDVISLIVRVGKPAQGPSDPYDLDYDGYITVLDARIAATLCTKLNCGL